MFPYLIHLPIDIFYRYQSIANSIRLFTPFCAWRTCFLTHSVIVWARYYSMLYKKKTPTNQSIWVNSHLHLETGILPPIPQSDSLKKIFSRNKSSKENIICVKFNNRFLSVLNILGNFENKFKQNKSIHITPWTIISQTLFSILLEKKSWTFAMQNFN